MTEITVPFVTAQVVHVKQVPDCTPIDRTTKWGNLYWIYHPNYKSFPLLEGEPEDGKRDVPHMEKVAAYGTQITQQVTNGEITLWDLWDLRKQKLGCWCKHSSHPDQACHGDILVEAIKWACQQLIAAGEIHFETGERIVGQFKDRYQFLSNMYKCQPFVDEHGITHSYSETYYMAEKFDDLATKKALSQMNGFEAKKYSQILLPNPPQSWHQKKDDVMRRALRYKYQDPVLRQQLLDTGDDFLVEGNFHNDKYWGFCLKTGTGLNKLGAMLMELRAEIRAEIAALKAQIEAAQ